MNPQHWEEHIAAGNVPHAILLAGNRGTGKKAFARRLATRYLGLTGETALTNCPYYTETADYAVENVRNISRAVNLQAYGRGRRCVVFFDAHNLTAQAQNALLKSLEEPPDDTLFLLTGNEAGLLPTVRSRCMTLRFGAKPVAEVAKELETEGIPKDRATLAAALSGGVIGPARDYATEEYRTFRARALEGIETLLFAAPPYQGLAALLSAQAEGKKKAAVQAEPLRRFLTIFASLLRDALAEGDRINIDCAILHGKITARFTNAQIQRMIKRTLEAERHLYFNANPGFVLDWLITNVQTTMYKLQ